MASNASSKSRSVPGSRSAVVSAAVVCRTKTEQVPVWFFSARRSSTRSVMSMTSRFLLVLTESRRMGGSGLPGGWSRMDRLILPNIGIVLEREAYIVETFKKAMASEVVDRELRAQPLIIPHRAAFQIDRELVPRNFRFAHNLCRFLFREHDSEHA